MTIYEIRHHAEEMEVPFKEALFMRFRFVRAEMLKELAEMDATDCPVMSRVALNRFMELAREQRALLMAAKQKNTTVGITDEQIERARQYPVTQLIDFQRGKSRAWCHEDRNPSLYLAPRINKAVCPVCAKYFDPIAIVMGRDGLTFTEAVRRLAA